MSRTGLAALAATLSCTLLLGLAGPAGAQTSPTTGLPKQGPLTGVSKHGQKFKGTFTINRFVSRGGNVFAVGTLKGKLKHRHVTRRGVRIPVSNFAKQGGAMSAQVTCPVLTLTLGPLDLNLLGLRVQLNRVNLRITAIQGGGLLGDLLCGLSGLLNPTGLTGGNLAAVLNSLLALVPTSPAAAGAAVG